jgi:hypothetical protein
MSETNPKRNWVERVLKIQLSRPGAPDEAERSYAPLVKRCEARWNRALQDAYKASKPVYGEVAAQSPGQADGLDSIFESYWSDLLAPLAQAKRGKGDPKAVGTVLQTVAALRAEMRSDPLFARLRGAGAPVDGGFLQALDDIETLLEPVGAP